MSHFFTVDLPLSENQEAGPNVPVDTAATGSATISYDPATGLVTIAGSFSNLSGPLLDVGGADATGQPESAVHVHVAGVGRNGPIAFNMAVTDNGDGSGSFGRTFAVTEEQAELFAAGGYYLNLHTVTNPSGELRGQLDVDSAQFDIVDATNPMSEDQQVGEMPVPDGPATGNVEVLFDGLTNRLEISGTFSGLVGGLLPVGGEDALGNPESAVHVHNALAGQNGPILRNLAVTDNGDGSGSFSGSFTLTDEEVADLRADAFYVNLHTDAFPSGELRAQLEPGTPPIDTVTRGLEMSESQEVGETPVPDTAATGSIDAVLDADTLTLTVSGTFANLSSPLMAVGGADPIGTPESAIHIHFAPAGQNGPIFRNLTVTDNGDGSGGFTGTFTLTEDEAATFAADQYYVNLHTMANPTGELRGQIDFDSGRFDDVTAGIPMSEDQEVAEEPVPDTAATGAYDATFDSATGILTIEGSFSGLSGPLLPVGGADAFGNPESPIHLHFGAPGENGPIVTNLRVQDNGDGSGSFGGSLVVPEQRIADFDAGNYYVNLHTEPNPGGELRGQLSLSSAIRDRTVIREETVGTRGDDTGLEGAPGDDVVRALTGDDRILASVGDDLVDGGAGFDTLIYGTPSDDLDVAIGADGATRIVASGIGGTTSVNVEALALDDGTLRLDVGPDGTAGTVARLYTGVLGREGEGSGLGFWIAEVEEDGFSFLGIADAFLASNEFAASFGESLSDDAFLDVLYQNLRGGAGDAAGLAFWQDALDAGVSRAQVALDFAGSLEAEQMNASLLDEGVFLA